MPTASFEDIDVAEPVSGSDSSSSPAVSGGTASFDDIEEKVSGTASLNDVTEKVPTPPSDTPLTDSALGQIGRAGRAVFQTLKEFVPTTLPGVVETALTTGPMGPTYQTGKKLYEMYQGAPPVQTAIAGTPVIQRISQIIEAEKTPAGSQERWNAGIGVLADLGVLAGIKGAPETVKAGGLRPEPLAPEAPPTVSLGPGTAAADVGKALERRFQMVPEQPPALEPVSSIEETVARAGQVQPRTSPETGEVFYPSTAEERLPVTAETAQIGGEQYAQQPGYAQVEGGEPALRGTEGTGGPLPETGRGDYVVGEAQGEGARGYVPGEEPVPTGQGVAPAAPEAYVPQSIEAEIGAGRPTGEEIVQPQTTALKNAVTSVERETRNLSPREEVERRNWDQAKAIADQEAVADPGKGARLVDELNQKPRALDDIEGAHLLRRKAEVNAEHDAAIRQMNSNPDDVNSMARLTAAREELQKTYNAAEVSGTAWGRSGRIRQALMAEDFSIGAMEAKARAIGNKGKPLAEPQLQKVATHYDKISKQEASIRLTEQSLQRPTGMQPKEILAEVEKMKQRLAPCL